MSTKPGLTLCEVFTAEKQATMKGNITMNTPHPEIYIQAVRNTLVPEAAERLLSGDLTATDDAGHEAIETECVRLTREAIEQD